MSFALSARLLVLGGLAFAATLISLEGHALDSKPPAEIRSSTELAERIRAVLPQRGSDSLAVMVFDVSNGREAFAFNPDKALKPASVLKVLSSLAALELLGPNYRFATRVFADRARTGEASSLYVQGAGDPSLTVETVWAMARAVRRRGIESVNQLYVDDSLFEESSGASGPRAYQTGSSALSFNYNAFSFEVCPGQVGKPASVIVDPLELRIPFVGGIGTSQGSKGSFAIDPIGGKSRTDGAAPTYRISGNIGSRQGCSTVYRSMPSPPKVFGASFLGMLKAVGVKVPEHPREGKTPGTLDLIYTQQSAPLSQIVRDLNHFSNNFIAEQILFAIGQTEGATFSRMRGLRRLESFLRSLGFRDEQFVLRDASGLSHDNRLSARIILALLLRGLENQLVAPEFESSLAVGKKSGTLQRRPVDPSGLVLRGKTGTLNGVSSLAGYVVGQSGNKYAFVVLQNAITSVDHAHRLEDSIVAILSRN